MYKRQTEEREIILPSLRQLFVSAFVTYFVRLPVLKFTCFEITRTPGRGISGMFVESMGVVF